MINAHGLTTDEMIFLEPMDVSDGRMVHGEVNTRHWRQEGTHHGCCGDRRRTCVAGYVPVVITEIEADLPLDHRIHQSPHDGEHGQRRHPFRLLQPHRTDGGRILDPAKAWFHRDRLLLIRLEHLDIRTRLGPQRGRQDRPPVRVRGRDHSRCGHAQPIADLDLGHLGLRRTASTRPLVGRPDGCHTIVERMIAPEPWPAATPALPPAFIVGDGRLSVGRTSTPAGFHALDRLGDALGLCGLGGAVGGGGLLGSLTGGPDEKTEVCQRESPLSGCHCYPAHDTAPLPAPCGFLSRPPGLFESQRPGALRLAPRLSRLPHGPGAWDQREQPHPPLQASPQGALTIGLTVGHKAAYPRQP